VLASVLGRTLPDKTGPVGAAVGLSLGNAVQNGNRIKTMKMRSVGLGVCCVLLGGAFNANAWLKVGGVFCDANTNGVLDAHDVPVPSVLVVVTNTSGTFSNANWTTAEGLFVVQLPDAPDSFVDYVHPLTLPAGTTEVLPAVSTFSTTADQPIVTNNFLIENPECVEVTPPETNRCWLTGGGTIKAGRGQPLHTFGGVVNPGCSPTAAGGGNWNDVFHAGNLHFKGLQIEVVNCGNLPGYPPGSKSPRTPFNFIDFQGVGTLVGIGHNHMNYGTVLFTARAVDLGEPGHGRDQLYLRVYDSAGNTLLLISADPANPLDVAPLTISTGNLQLHVSGCDR
jgi:hypothetical protein